MVTHKACSFSFVPTKLLMGNSMVTSNKYNNTFSKINTLIIPAFLAALYVK
jgi:hypothetical protein